MAFPPATVFPRGDQIQVAQFNDGRVIRLEQVLSQGLLYRGPKGLTIIVSVDDTPKGELLHVSLSYPDRSPSWRDIRAVKDVFFGLDKAAMQILPEEEFYTNLHPHCFHLWEMPGGWNWNFSV